MWRKRPEHVHNNKCHGNNPPEVTCQNEPPRQVSAVGVLHPQESLGEQTIAGLSHTIIPLHPVSAGFPRSPLESPGTFPGKTGSCFSTTDHFSNISNTYYYFWTSSKGSDFAVNGLSPAFCLSLYLSMYFSFFAIRSCCPGQPQTPSTPVILLPQCPLQLGFEMPVTTAPCYFFCF